MNTILSRPAAIAAAALFASTLALNAFAGPGVQALSNGSKTELAAAPTSSAGVCPGSKVVAVTALESSWVNGRGPLAPVQVGTKRVCTMCPVTSVTAHGAANGRGPQTQTETARTGVEHDCTSGCPASKA